MELLPTFDRPMNANSGNLGGGHWASETQDCTYSDWVTLWFSAGSIISARLGSTMTFPTISSSFIPLGVGTLRIRFSGAAGLPGRRGPPSSPPLPSCLSSLSPSTELSSEAERGAAGAPVAGALGRPPTASGSGASSPPEVDASDARDALAATPDLPNVAPSVERSLHPAVSLRSFGVLRSLVLHTPDAAAGAPGTCALCTADVTRRRCLKSPASWQARTLMTRPNIDYCVPVVSVAAGNNVAERGPAHGQHNCDDRRKQSVLPSSLLDSEAHPCGAVELTPQQCLPAVLHRRRSLSRRVPLPAEHQLLDCAPPRHDQEDGHSRHNVAVLLQRLQQRLRLRDRHPLRPGGKPARPRASARDSIKRQDSFPVHAPRPRARRGRGHSGRGAQSARALTSSRFSSGSSGAASFTAPGVPSSSHALVFACVHPGYPTCGPGDRTIAQNRALCTSAISKHARRLPRADSPLPGEPFRLSPPGNSPQPRGPRAPQPPAVSCPSCTPARGPTPAAAPRGRTSRPGGDPGRRTRTRLQSAEGAVVGCLSDVSHGPLRTLMVRFSR